MFEEEIILKKLKNKIFLNIFDDVINYHDDEVVLKRQRKIKFIYNKKRLFLAKVFLKNKFLFLIINFLYALVILLKRVTIFYRNISKVKILFVTKTQNQYDSLLPYYNLINDSSSIFYTCDKQIKTIKTGKIKISVIEFFELLNNYFKYLPVIYKQRMRNELYAFDIFLLPINICYYYYFLRKTNVKKIFISSEQDIETFIFKELSKLLNIKIYYVQHASIGTGLASNPLSYDISFLDSQDTYDTYHKIGINDKRNVILVGAKKYLGKTKKIKSLQLKNIKIIGISIGSTFNKESLKNYISVLIKENNDRITFIIRQHPGKDIEEYYLEEDTLKALNINIIYQDSKKNDIQSYINAIDINISSVSSVHLDILNYGKISLFFNPFNEDDIYKFVSKGLIKEIKSLNDINQDSLNFYVQTEYIKIMKYFNFNYLEEESVINKKILNAIK